MAIWQFHIRLARACGPLLLLALLCGNALGQGYQPCGCAPRTEPCRCVTDTAPASPPDFPLPGEHELADVDGLIEPVMFQEPGAGTAPRRPSRRPTYGAQPGRSASAPSTADLADYVASAPRMFGHFFSPPYQLTVGGQFDGANGTPNGVVPLLTTDIPAAGGAGRMSIADNNGALPGDRFLLNYNHFENAFSANSPALPFVPGAQGTRRDFSVDRFIIGGEKSFLDGIASVQVQIPVTGQLQFGGGGFGGPGGIAGPGISGGRVGNLGVITKVLLWRTEQIAISTGLGLDLPTGSDVNGTIFANRYRLRNDTVHISPFLAFLAAPTETIFIQGFTQVDVATTGNRFEFADTPGGPFVSQGRLNDQTLIELDMAAGRWVYRNPGGPGLTGLAGLVELHYVSTANNADRLQFNSTTQSPFGNAATLYQLGSPSNRRDILNFTLGVHTQWFDRAQFRVGAVFPLSNVSNRTFDSEVFAQLNWLL